MRVFRVMLYLTFLCLSITLSLCTFGQIEAKLEILQGSSNRTTTSNGNLTIVAVSFKNISNRDIYVPYVMQLLTDSSGGGVFTIYKNGKLLERRLDYQLSGKLEPGLYSENKPGAPIVITHPTPLFVLQEKLNSGFFDYIVDSVTTYNKTKNYKIADSFLASSASQKFNPNALRFLINGNSLFLKAGEEHKFFFVSNISDVLKTPGEYTILYQPGFKKPGVSSWTPDIKNILGYEQFIPNKVDCNKLIINII